MIRVSLFFLHSSFNKYFLYLCTKNKYTKKYSSMKDVTRLFDIPAYQLEQYPIENALVTK